MRLSVANAKLGSRAQDPATPLAFSEQMLPESMVLAPAKHCEPK
jgi:hypothetical protein